MNHSSVKMR